MSAINGMINAGRQAAGAARKVAPVAIRFFNSIRGIFSKVDDAAKPEVLRRATDFVNGFISKLARTDIGGKIISKIGVGAETGIYTQTVTGSFQLLARSMDDMIASFIKPGTRFQEMAEDVKIVFFEANRPTAAETTWGQFVKNVCKGFEEAVRF